MSDERPDFTEPPKESQPDKTPAADYLREWGFDLATFETRAKKSIDAARGDLSEVTGVLRQELTKTKQVLIDLQRARGPVGAELKTGFERAWDAIEESFARARQRMRESREAETAKEAENAKMPTEDEKRPPDA
jgi:uncharacterized protein YicC (UPF0701 family)